LSTDDARAHFGVGAASHIDSLLITWPDGKTQLLNNLPVDTTILMSYKDATQSKKVDTFQPDSALFTNVSSRYGIKYKPKERDFVDYNIQPTLPHKLSQYGPGIAVGDVDNNGFEDFYLGGSSGNPGVFFMQSALGKFTLDSTRFLQHEDRLHEDMGVLLFDADNDKDLDLLIVGGSYEIPPNHPISNDQLFTNNGKGRFSRNADALPKDSTNGSCVRAADIDGDGDLDLFVGGRVVSGAYPRTPKSFILKNHNGKFSDVTREYCEELQYLGMVTDALWSDFDNDGKVDLVVAGEWMPVTFFKNTGKGLIRIKNPATDSHLGWWNSLTAGDFDNDGDIDYVAGNFGLNTNYKASAEEPITILAKDLDNNGSLDAMVFCYLRAEDGSMQPFPMATKDDMAGQMISIRKKYPTYKAYAAATMNDLWNKSDRQGAIMMEANDMASSYIENRGNNQFLIKPLPLQAQVAPVYGMISQDMDADGNLDVILVGNDYGVEPFSGRHDAFMGLCLKGNGKGEFVPLTVAASGFFVNGDAKGLAQIHTAKNEQLLVATQNQDSLVAFSKNKLSANSVSKWVTLNQDDYAAEIVYKDGRKRRVEFYYGSTYLSQSTRKIPFEKAFEKITIINFKGVKRQVL
jgi:hypothetical protein